MPRPLTSNHSFSFFLSSSLERSISKDSGAFWSMTATLAEMVAYWFL